MQLCTYTPAASECGQHQEASVWCPFRSWYSKLSACPNQHWSSTCAAGVSQGHMPQGCMPQLQHRWPSITACCRTPTWKLPPADPQSRLCPDSQQSTHLRVSAVSVHGRRQQLHQLGLAGCSSVLLCVIKWRAAQLIRQAGVSTSLEQHLGGLEQPAARSGITPPFRD